MMELLREQPRNKKTQVVMYLVILLILIGTTIWALFEGIFSGFGALALPVSVLLIIWAFFSFLTLLRQKPKWMLFFVHFEMILITGLSLFFPVLYLTRFIEKLIHYIKLKYIIGSWIYVGHLLPISISVVGLVLTTLWIIGILKGAYEFPPIFSDELQLRRLRIIQAMIYSLTPLITVFLIVLLSAW